MAAVTRWIAGCLPLFASAGCSSDCEALCRTITDCRDYCDEGEGEICSDSEEEGERERDREDCERECANAAEDKGERCEDAASIYRDCTDRHTCKQKPCSGESTRYFDSCQADRFGQASCSAVCDQLEYGCLPFELFGHPGPDCHEACLAAANERSCGEALFELEECQIEHADPVAPCLQIDKTCLAKAETFVDRCAGFARTTADPADEALCASAAIVACTCTEKSYPDPACEPRETDRCLYELQSGDPCRTAWREYALCLESLEVCSSTSISENCQTQSGARFDECQ